jgi:uncharacterized protein (TIGR02594 family)
VFTIERDEFSAAAFSSSSRHGRRQFGARCCVAASNRNNKKDRPVMVLRRTGILVCLIALFAAPASAQPLGKANTGPAHRSADAGEFVEWSARKRHRAARHHARRHYAARHRVPQFARTAAMPGIGDLHGVAADSYASAGAVHAGAMRDVGGTGLIAEARRYIGTNPTGRSSLWCGHFMNMVLERSGHRNSGSNTARSFASYGRRVSGPQIGAIAVMSRRGGGHVGVVSGIDANGNVIVISGNHNRRVAESIYPRSRIYAYVMP